MIILQSQSNTQFVTRSSILADLSTNPYFLFRFENLATLQNSLFYFDKENAGSTAFDVFNCPSESLEEGEYRLHIYSSPTVENEDYEALDRLEVYLCKVQ